MRAHFAEVLARESAHLAGVTDCVKLAGWRRQVVRELMIPCSPYARAMQQTRDVQERADFVGRWRGLLADTVERLMHDGNGSKGDGRDDHVDPEKVAVLILAALHGGGALSQVARDPRPLDAALDLALAPLVAPKGRNSRHHGE